MRVIVLSGMRANFQRNVHCGEKLYWFDFICGQYGCVPQRPSSTDNGCNVLFTTNELMRGVIYYIHIFRNLNYNSFLFLGIELENIGTFYANWKALCKSPG